MTTADVPRSPARSTQDILASDRIAAPAIFRMESPRDMGRGDISLDRCYTREWHEREIKTVWQKTWQMACRVEDIPSTMFLRGARSTVLSCRKVSRVPRWGNILSRKSSMPCAAICRSMAAATLLWAKAKPLARKLLTAPSCWQSHHRWY